MLKIPQIISPGYESVKNESKQMCIFYKITLVRVPYEKELFI